MHRAKIEIEVNMHAEKIKRLEFEIPNRFWADHARLADFNHTRLTPGYPSANPQAHLESEFLHRMLEQRILRAERAFVSEQAASAPSGSQAFLEWFEELKTTGPGKKPGCSLGWRKKRTMNK